MNRYLPLTEQLSKQVFQAFTNVRVGTMLCIELRYEADFINQGFFLRISG